MISSWTEELKVDHSTDDSSLPLCIGHIEQWIACSRVGRQQEKDGATMGPLSPSPGPAAKFPEDLGAQNFAR